MKGIELAEAYFNAHGLPMIRDQFGDKAHLIAAGLVGPGSECYGYDDHLSRDHDWGPGFCMWLDRPDYERFGHRLQKAYQMLPKEFMGFGPRQTSQGEAHRVGVVATQDFYRAYTGCDHIPDRVEQWLRIPDQNLSVCTNGKVFQDPLGHFTAWRGALLRYYPEDVRLQKIAVCCVNAAQSGQVNYQRSLERQEWFALSYAEVQFCDHVLWLTFLLNKSYAPYYKWRHRAVKSLSTLGRWVHQRIEKLLTTGDASAKKACIQDVCQHLVRELKRQQLTDSDSEFLMDHVQPIIARIETPALQQQFSMVP